MLDVLHSSLHTLRSTALRQLDDRYPIATFAVAPSLKVIHQRMSLQRRTHGFFERAGPVPVDDAHPRQPGRVRRVEMSLQQDERVVGSFAAQV
jgi:hypothetical protein